MTDDETGAAGAETADGEGARTELVARVAEHDEDLAVEVADLEAEAAALSADLEDREGEIEDLESRLKRKQADFENYKKRAERRREELEERATEALVERLVEVRDNLVRALDQEEGAEIRGGVEATLSEFDRVLEEEGVDAIEPEPGTDVDPRRHEVLMRVESDEPAGTVADRHRPGYEMGGTVLRPAQVTVSEAEDGES